MSEYDYLFKVIVVGDGGVGKTAIAVRFAEGVFRDDYKMTIGVDFSIKTLDIQINGYGMRRVKFQIWDTGGQERFSYTRPLYYKGAVGGLVVFDLSNRRSFENLDRWFTEVAETCFSIPLILVGNKADLPDRVVARSEAEALARERNIPYYESSAKSGQSINTIFDKLGKLIVMIQEGLVIKEEEEEERKHKEYIEKYMTLADLAFQKINDANYQEALKYLKEAYKYAKEIDYKDGKKWIEEQTQLILKILKQQQAMGTQQPEIYMYCAYCNRKYRVAKIGKIRCPKCNNYLSSSA
ncbi:MAG: GTP-binding protein [Candidatus Helarchaeota archaeon]